MCECVNIFGVNVLCYLFIGFKGVCIVFFILCVFCKLLCCVKVGDDYLYDFLLVVIRFMFLKICCFFLIFIFFYVVIVGYLSYLYRLCSFYYRINKNKLLIDL